MTGLFFNANCHELTVNYFFRQEDRRTGLDASHECFLSLTEVYLPQIFLLLSQNARNSRNYASRVFAH